eukprot:6346707-Amphidinium_carterae.3
MRADCWWADHELEHEVSCTKCLAQNAITIILAKDKSRSKSQDAQKLAGELLTCLVGCAVLQEVHGAKPRSDAFAQICTANRRQS